MIQLCFSQISIRSTVEAIGSDAFSDFNECRINMAHWSLIRQGGLQRNGFGVCRHRRLIRDHHLTLSIPVTWFRWIQTVSQYFDMGPITSVYIYIYWCVYWKNYNLSPHAYILFPLSTICFSACVYEAIIQTYAISLCVIWMVIYALCPYAGMSLHFLSTYRRPILLSP